MTENCKVIDGRKYFINYESLIMETKSDKYPYLFLNADLSSWISNRIQFHTKNNYSHAGILMSPFVTAEQRWRFEKFYVDINEKTDRFKVIQMELTEAERYSFQGALSHLLKKRGRYDWLGIFGQRFKRKWINFGFRNYCSEAVAYCINQAKIFRDSKYVFAPRYPSPGDLDRFYGLHPEVFTEVGIVDAKIIKKYFK